MPRQVNQAGPGERLYRQIYQRADLTFEARRARQNLRKQLQNLKVRKPGDKKQFAREVLPFWRQYGLKPRKFWYDLYCANMDHYDPHYIPADLYWQKIYPALNQVHLRRAYTNKCLLDTFFPAVKRPQTILCNINGSFSDSHGQLISARQAADLVNNTDSFVIKPAFYSGGGRDIYFNSPDLTFRLEPEHLFKRYRSDFVIQETVTQHDVLAAIHPQSVNTIRTISLLFGGTIHITSSILRMGTRGAKMDNFAAGGIACPISHSGRLQRFAIDSTPAWLERHPDGAVFEKITVPSYQRVLQIIRKIHPQVPFFRLIGWDFAIDQAGDPVLIEYNGAPDLNQLSCGPLFGSLTPQVLDYLFLKQEEPDLATELYPQAAG